MSALTEIADRVLDQRLQTAHDLALGACPNDEQRKGIDALWQRIAGSYGQTWAHAAAIEKAYAEGVELTRELSG